MTGYANDVDLPLPETIGRVPKLGSYSAGLAISATASDSSFLLEGSRVTVRGQQRASIGEIRIDGRLVAMDISADPTHAVANLMVSPGRLRRELVTRAGTVLETVVVARSLPLVAIQWARYSGGPATVSLTILPGRGDVRHRIGQSSLTISTPMADSDMVVLALSPEGTWSVEPTNTGGLEVTGSMTGAGPHTLLLSGGEPRQALAALASAKHLDVHEKLATDHDRTQGLVLASGVRQLDEGIAWARSRLAGALARAARQREDRVTDPESICWSGIGALAAGDEEAITHSLSLLDGCEDWVWPALLAGRVALHTGNAEAAYRLAGVLAAGSVDAADSAPARMALLTLADGLRHAAPDALISKLRADARGETPTLTGRRLPTVGPATNSTTVAAWLANTLEQSSGARTLAEPSGSTKPRGDSERDASSVWSAWRAELDNGLFDGPSGPGTWDEWRLGLVGAPKTGRLLATFVHGTLGFHPDAPAGRARIAPFLPEHLTSLRVSGLMLGAAGLGLSYERAPGLHRFTLEPERGRVPSMAVFEPTVPGRVSETRIDGAEANLEVSAVGSGSRISVQIPVDTVRTVELLTE